jgi:DNA-binding MarR family transcriptional regulator
MRSGRISVSTLEALIHLRFVRGQEMMLKELAEAVDLTTSAITGVADAMERLGFAKRMWNEMDRRQTWIGLTPEGVTFVDRIQSMLARTLAGPSIGPESLPRK